MMMFALETLMQRVMFGVDRQQLCARLFGGPSHQLARHHECFLICERDSLAGFERPQCRNKTNRTYGRGNDTISLGVSCDLQ